MPKTVSRKRSIDRTNLSEGKEWVSVASDESGRVIGQSTKRGAKGLSQARQRAMVGDKGMAKLQAKGNVKATSSDDELVKMVKDAAAKGKATSRSSYE